MSSRVTFSNIVICKNFTLDNTNTTYTEYIKLSDKGTHIKKKNRKGWKKHLTEDNKVINVFVIF
jgi:hypothetical protein